MTAPLSHIIKSVVFTPSTGTAVTITGVQNAEVQLGGQRHTWSGDGAATVQAQSMEDIEGSATISTTDLSVAKNAALKIGTSGGLVIVYSQRGPRGAAAATDITCTLAAALVESVAPGAPHRGESTLQIQFGAVSADGAVDPVVHT